MTEISQLKMHQLIGNAPFEITGNFVVGTVWLYHLEDGTVVARENGGIFYLKASELPEYLESLEKRRVRILEENKRIKMNHYYFCQLTASIKGKAEFIGSPIAGCVKQFTLPDGASVVSKHTYSTWEYFYLQEGEIETFKEELEAEQKEILAHLSLEDISSRKWLLALIK